jgi:hypothetical protein
MRRLSRRAKAILATAAALAIGVNGAAAWAYWTITGGGFSTSTAGSVVELQVGAVTYPASPVYPGSRSSIRVTIKNDNSFPIKITQVRPGTSAISVDTAHRSAGCINSGMSMTASVYSVLWPVAKKTTAVYVLPTAIKMTNVSDSACQGATFKIPLRLAGTSNA